MMSYAYHGDFALQYRKIYRSGNMPYNFAPHIIAVRGIRFNTNSIYE